MYVAGRGEKGLRYLIGYSSRRRESEEKAKLMTDWTEKIKVEAGGKCGMRFIVPIVIAHALWAASNRRQLAKTPRHMVHIWGIHLHLILFIPIVFFFILTFVTFPILFLVCFC